MKRDAALLLLLTACQVQQPAAQLHKLPSGKSISILSISTMHFAKDDPALMLKYQTEIDLSDQAALQTEVEEIWTEFKNDADRAKVTGAVIIATSKPTGGFIQQSKMYNFIFKKDASGTWALSAGQ